MVELPSSSAAREGVLDLLTKGLGNTIKGVGEDIRTREDPADTKEMEMDMVVGVITTMGVVAADIVTTGMGVTGINLVGTTISEETTVVFAKQETQAHSLTRNWNWSSSACRRSSQ